MGEHRSIVFISRNRVLPGRLDDLRAFLRAGVPVIEADKPRTLAFLPYLDASGERLVIVHVFADPEAFDLHLAGADERSRAAYELIAPESFEIYGPLSDVTREKFRASAASAGVPLTLAPEAPAGFLRPGS